MRHVWCVLGAGGLLVAVAACKSSTGSGSGCGSTGANAIVQATDAKQFNPTPLRIGQAQTVCWENNGTLTHSVTFDPPDSTDDALAPGYVALKGFGTTQTDYTYHCKYHPGMTGTIQVR